MPDKIEKRAIIDVRLETEKARQAARDLKIEISRLETEQKKYNKLLKEAQKQGDKTANRQKILADKLRQVQTDLRGARGEFSKYAKEVNEGNEIFKRSGGLTNSLTTAFTSLAMQVVSVYGAFRLMKGVVVGSIKDFAEFEKTLVNVQTLLTYNEETLRRGALDIIPKYGFAIKDVNRALFDAISAGIPATQSIEFLHEASILAVGGVTDLRTAVDGLTSILNTYSLSTAHAAEVSDAFYVAQKYGKTTVEKLVNQIGRVAPIAQIANVSFQEMLGSLASLTKGGLNTEESVTILRQVISALIKPAHQASLVLRDASVPTGLLAIKTKGLVFALEQLNQAYRENPDAIAEMIPNIRAFTGVAAFNSERLIELKKIINDVYKDNTSLSRAFGEQMDTLQKKWEVAKGRIKAFRIEIGDRLAPVLKHVIDRFSDWIDISKTHIELTETATERLNDELTALQNINLTQEQRAASIKSINERYAAYLENAIDEKSLLEDLAKLQLLIIHGLKGRILYMRYIADLKKVQEEYTDATVTLTKAQRELDIAYQKGHIDRVKITKEEEKWMSSSLDDMSYLSEEDQKHLKNRLEMWNTFAMIKLRMLKSEGVGWEELTDRMQKAFIQLQEARIEHAKNIIATEKDSTKAVTDFYEAAAEAGGWNLKELGKIYETFLKKTDEPGKGLGLIERRKREAALLDFKRKIQDDELSMMEDGLNKRMIRETLDYDERIANLKSYILTEEELKRPLLPDEIKSNKEFYAAMEELTKIHMLKMMGIEVEWWKESEKSVRQLRKKYGLGTIEELRELEIKALENSKEFALLSESEKLEALAYMRKKWQDEDDKKERTANEKIVRFKKKYRLDSAKELRADEIAAFEKSTEYLELSQEERERGLFNIKKKYLDDYIDMAIDMSGDLANMIMDFEMDRKSRQYDHEMELLRNAKDAESQILKNKLDKDLISEEAYKAAQDALAEKHERKRIALEKKKFEQDKKHAIAQTLIAGSVAAMRVIAEYWGAPKAWIMAAAIGFKTAWEVALISAQKYAMGGFADFKEGMLKGVGTWNSDNILGALSPGEIILNAKVGANPALRAQASAINVAAGGVPFADGGMSARNISAEVEQSFISANQIRTIVESMPPQIVLVKDILSGTERVVRVEERANV